MQLMLNRSVQRHCGASNVKVITTSSDRVRRRWLTTTCRVSGAPMAASLRVPRSAIGLRQDVRNLSDTALRWDEVAGLGVPRYPCSIGGSPHSYLLQRILAKYEQKDVQLKRKALQCLLEAAGPPTSDATYALREKQMHQALHVLNCTGAFPTGPWHREALPYSVCRGVPPGHVCVPKVIGEAFLYLRSRGMDAEGWWGRFYESHMKLCEDAPTALCEGGEEGPIDLTSTHSDAATVLKRCAKAQPPPLCWIWRKSWSSPPQHRALDSLYFAVPLPFYTDHKELRHIAASSPMKSTFLEMGSSDEGAVTEDSLKTAPTPASKPAFWIPLQLLAHLPFFPIPFPRTENASGHLEMPLRAHNEMEDAPWSRSTAISADIIVPSDDSVTQSVSAVSRATGGTSWAAQEFYIGACAGRAALVHTPESIPPDGAAVGLQDPASFSSFPVGGSLQGRCGWMHPFYEELFTPPPQLGNRVRNREVYQCRYEAGLRSTAGVGFYLEDRSSTPSSGDAVVRGPHSSIRNAWRPPHIAWAIVPQYCRYISTFWASKACPMDDLPFNYLFPFKAFALLRFLRLSSERRRRKDKGALTAWKVSERFAPPLEKSCTTSQWILPAKVERHHGPRRDSSWGRHQNGERGSGTFDGGVSLSGVTDASSQPFRSAFDVVFCSSGQQMVSYFGSRYVDVEATALACLFDSTTCAEQAVPLSETGQVFWWGLRETRCRQHHRFNVSEDCKMRLHSGPASSSTEHTPGFRFPVSPQRCRSTCWDTAMKKLKAAEASVGDKCIADAGRSTVLATPPWLTRLREISRGGEAYTTPRERSIMRRSWSHDTRYTFQSPYWVKVEHLYEHWGVHVATGVVPLSIRGDSYVNAEQTTDASRFSSCTCVPHLQQEVFCLQGLVYCTWDGSQRLIRRLAPDALPRRRKGGLCAWTVETLCQRALAVQRHSNLWVEEEVVKKFRWTLRPVPLSQLRSCSAHTSNVNEENITGNAVLREDLPLSELLGKKSSRALVASSCDEEERRRLNGQAQKQLSSPLRERDLPLRKEEVSSSGFLGACVAGRDAMHRFPAYHPLPKSSSEGIASRGEPTSTSSSLSLIHSSCVTQQAELEFVAAYSPLVLLLCVPELEEGDEGFYEYRVAKQQHESKVSCKTPGDAASQPAVKSVIDIHSSSSAFGEDADVGAQEQKKSVGDRVNRTDTEEADGALAERKSAPPGNLIRAVEKCYKEAMRKKKRRCMAPWTSARLSFASRVELAHVALQRGYTAKDAEQWVSADFLCSEPRVRQAKPTAAATKEPHRADASPPTPITARDAAATVDRLSPSDESSRLPASPVPGPGASQGITAVEVSVWVRTNFGADSTLRNRRAAGDGTDDLEKEGRWDSDGCETEVTSFDSVGVKEVRLTLVNRGELELPKELLTSPYAERCVWKNL